MRNHPVFCVLMIFSFAFVILPVGTASARVQIPEVEIGRETLYVPGEVVIGFDHNFPQVEMQTRAEALAGPVGAVVVGQYANLVLLSVDPDADVISLAGQLSGQADVIFAEPNYISWVPEMDPLGTVLQLSEITPRQQDGVTITRSIEELRSMRTIIRGNVRPTYPNDEYANWGNSRIEHDIIWVNRNASPVVCVIDSGVDGKHPDLKGKIIKGYDFVNNDRTPYDDNGHGTHVAGTIVAKTGNGIGPAGISNGKVLAVKALNAQGWGTAFDIASAIYYCASNKSVKIINMSLGSSAVSSTEYDALDFAINEKGMLVVTAAGNDSTSNFSYPSGWAQDTLIGGGLVSVGASRLPSELSGYDLWVDTNGNDAEDSGEIYSSNDCATDFSNYGGWVEMVAPGESIYSTLPVSYPFWNNYFGGSSPEYDSWSGTSMAAPHVSGAAARVWSFYRNQTNFWIHDRLLDPGRSYSLTLAADPQVPDPTKGYDQIIPSGPGAGQPYGPIDDDTIRAPFCWPESNSSFGENQDMSDARFLSVAAAMDRVAFVLEVTDATTGLPLKGATASVRDGSTWRNVISAKMTSMTTRYVDLINIPAQDPEFPNKTKIYHPIYVNMRGYTAEPQIIAGAYSYPGGYHWGRWFQVGVPPKKGTTVVANWYSGYDLDLFAFLPSGAPRGVIGSGKSGHPNDIGEGTLLDYPYTRWHRNGGGEDNVGVEAITMANYPGQLYPYYLKVFAGYYYDVLIRDYNNGVDLNAAEPIFRIWSNGELFFSRAKKDICEVDEGWWKLISISRDDYINGDICGTGETGSGGVWPYAEGTAMFYTSQVP